EKRAQFLADHVAEINALEERYHKSGRKDKNVAALIETWHDQLRQITAGEEAQIRKLEKERSSFDIADPIGGGIDDYRRTRGELYALLTKLVDQLKKMDQNNDER